MRRVIGVIAVGVLTATACGGASDASQTTDAATATTEPPVTDPPDTATATTGPPVTDPPVTDPPVTDPPVTDPPITDPADLPPVVVVSEDGALAIEVSAADAERVNPSIRILDRSEWPPELAGSDERSGVVIYELEPDGATFDEPVIVTRALEVAAFGPDIGEFDVPLVVMVTQADDGQFELLADLEAMRIGDTLLTSASTTHFSPIVTANIAATVRFPVDLPTMPGLPSEGVAQAPGDRLRRVNHTTQVDFGTVPVASPIDLVDLAELPDPVSVEFSGQAVSGSRPAIAPPKPLDQGGTATGGKAATELHRIFTEVDISLTGIADVLEALGIDQLPSDIRLMAALVIGSTDDAETEKQFEVLRVMAEEAGFTMEVVHTPLGAFPSFTRKKLAVRQLPEGYAAASVTLAGGLADGSIVDVAMMNWKDDAYVAKTGLVSYGPINEAVLVGPEDQVQQFVDDPAGGWPLQPPAVGSPSPVRYGVTLDGEPTLILIDEDEGDVFDRRVNMWPF